jgi:hypothetical protein
MFRRLVYFGAGIFAILLLGGSPGQVHAQRHRGGAHMMRPRTGMNNGFMRNNNRFMPGFGFDSRFRGEAFDPRFGRGRSDRLEDRFENRFDRGFGFTPGFAGGFFDPRSTSGFSGGFFNPLSPFGMRGGFPIFP